MLVGILVSAGSILLVVRVARRQARIRPGFDVARVVLGIGSAIVLGLVTAVQTPGWLAVVAVGAGAALGYFQGGQLQVTIRDGSGFATRTMLGIVLWGGGLLAMQAAGLASRTGVFRLGQALAFFSIAITVGLMAGRSGPVQEARKAAASVAAAAVVALVVAPVALVAGHAVPADAQSGLFTDAELCDFTPRDGFWGHGVFITDSDLSILGIVNHEVTVPSALAACSNGFELDDGVRIAVG
ncbi:MAG: hypothetical protein ACE5GC_02410, partial [Acidimicrobiia bacterium]